MEGEPAPRVALLDSCIVHSLFMHNYDVRPKAAAQVPREACPKVSAREQNLRLAPMRR